ncbi:MAG: acyl-CoA/acyl-ACP dehydrogenase [Alphaproteobacteria bacterium]|nr:acyl-CoA/acyl-ACP dehydrogenase [Alphaproteobacteria bacterium]
MNFDFSDEQKMLREQARKFLSGKRTTQSARRILEGTGGYDRELWKDVAEMGWLGTAIPEAYGGLGLGPLELCVIAEEMGRALAPLPFSSTVYLFTEAVLLAATEGQKRKYLPSLARGELIGTFARVERAGAAAPKSIRTSFRSGKLSGRKIAVSDGMDADVGVVLARSGDEPGERGLCLAIADLSGAGVSRRVEDSIDPSRKHAEITFDGAPAEPLGAPGEGWRIAATVLDRAAVLTAFEQIGGADVCLATATEYAKTRYAFARPIGSYQAIKHKLADMYVNNELARSNAYYGAWALHTASAELPLAAAAARVSATQAFDYAAKEMIQIHGGIGFTWEADCHLFYRRSRELALGLGAQRSWKDRVVSELETRNTA